MSLSPHSPFPRARALWAHLKAPSSRPRSGSGISSVLFPFPFPGCTQVGNDRKQDSLWGWAMLEEPHPPSPAFKGVVGLVCP